ncbi:heparin lyase I family protein [Phenylobacterium deserti]|uniref:Polysaccharide lyase family 7 protein n=1 Tax=Phenylobacterium deserti TaxID=1914756 RepID=A0A328AVE7_9CAUL|nr:heparin lyase I family protein [Phenylobacterium deserti]RAK58141.1 hypothetical protein DJ018_09610 [Phenylobacterium deserti]
MRPSRGLLVIALSSASMVHGTCVAGEPPSRAARSGEPRWPSRTLTFDELAIQEQSAGAPWSIKRANGEYRFEVRQGERRLKAGERERPIERSEIQLQPRLHFGVDYTVSYEFKVEPGPPNASAWVNIGQIHATEDPEDAKRLGPLFAVQLAGERMRIVARADPQRISVSRPRDLWLFRDNADLVRGRWHRMDIEIRVAPLGDGRLVVKRDGLEIVKYAGPLGYNDAVGPYWKLGIYRSTSPEPLVVEFRRFTLTEGAGAAASAALR